MSELVLVERFGLLVNAKGEIFSKKTGRKRKLWTTKSGHKQLAVRGRTSYLAHRIVAEAFIPNPDNKPFVNHINGNPGDNRVENLEWVTAQENIRHARDVLGVKYSSPGFQNPNAKFLESHRVILRNLYAYGFSVAEISALMGFCKPTIRRHLGAIIRSNELGLGGYQKLKTKSSKSKQTQPRTN